MKAPKGGDLGLFARLSCESGCLRVQPQEGGKLHLRLNIATRPILNKYREGKLKRTLKREFKERENRHEVKAVGLT